MTVEELYLILKDAMEKDLGDQEVLINLEGGLWCQFFDFTFRADVNTQYITEASPGNSDCFIIDTHCKEPPFIYQFTENKE